jgi:hypothetical protein
VVVVVECVLEWRIVVVEVVVVVVVVVEVVLEWRLWW